MKFAKCLASNVQPEWRVYAVQYKKLKQVLNPSKSNPSTTSQPTPPSPPPSLNVDIDVDLFDKIIAESASNLKKFFESKDQWATEYVSTLENRVSKLQQSEETSVLSRRNSFVGDPESEHGSSPPNMVTVTPNPNGSSSDNDTDPETDDFVMGTGNILSTEDMSPGERPPRSPVSPEQSMMGPMSRLRLNTGGSSGALSKGGFTSTGSLKDMCRETAANEHFKDYIYSIKSLRTFEREVSLLLEFLSLNKTGFSKIFKKFDKITGRETRASKMTTMVQVTIPFLETGGALRPMLSKVQALINKTLLLKPLLPSGWSDRKVYTIGCFDLFHRGHANVLHSLREFGHFIVAGIHDDASYFKLKKKHPIDNLEKRMANLKPHVDMIYVIPSTDPMPYIQMAVSDQDIEQGLCCYARGDDMLEFPGRTWVESVMPVHFLPRTEGCSSSLIRIIYHGGDEEAGKKAAFAKTRYDGKPVDDNGDIIRTN
ncbi:hypothetical protein TrLO_g10970 [Triparma laevis f. longispina]|uniref:SPX domain-containing protein n=1 Tax=Triparma laevis f. longispina TaxID=1714387 RepID=A0A9W6ZKR7_9STRA|nr:hypothetical protein TrLO_g10970 [Triparma laevis f. longispina]